MLQSYMAGNESHRRNGNERGIQGRNHTNQSEFNCDSSNQKKKHKNNTDFLLLLITPSPRNGMAYG